MQAMDPTLALVAEVDAELAEAIFLRESAEEGGGRRGVQPFEGEGLDVDEGALAGFAGIGHAAIDDMRAAVLAVLVDREDETDDGSSQGLRWCCNQSPCLAALSSPLGDQSRQISGGRTRSESNSIMLKAIDMRSSLPSLAGTEW